MAQALSASRVTASASAASSSPGSYSSRRRSKSVVWRATSSPRRARAFEEGVGVRARLAEPVPAAELVGVVLGRGERGQVGRRLDPLATIVAAGVAGDLRSPVDDPELVFGRDEGRTPRRQIRT
jgi:hypothetical protein